MYLIFQAQTLVGAKKYDRLWSSHWRRAHDKLELCVRVSVCVCVREREREKCLQVSLTLSERGWESEREWGNQNSEVRPIMWERHNATVMRSICAILMYHCFCYNLYLLPYITVLIVKFLYTHLRPIYLKIFNIYPPYPLILLPPCPSI